jgi:membrane protease YdiL (CAAX protease family)
MELLVNKLISSLVQIIIFSVIPFIWWLITARKKQKFNEWIGLKAPIGGTKTAFAIIGVSFAFLILGAYSLYIVSGIETATSDFRGLGTAAIPAILVYAVLNTSFPEEIIFRGFLLKRLQNKFGFIAANVIQSIIFGVVHAVMFFNLVGTAKAIIILIFTAAIAWFMGYTNEKKADGSIIPSWTIHAIANIFSGLCAAFMIF